MGKKCFISSRKIYSNEIMYEQSSNFLWPFPDKIGTGATSTVHKAYDKKTGETVAAKVSKFPSRPSNPEKQNNHPSVFDREVNFLRKANHENIVRFMGKEIVILSDDPNALPNREVLFMEYCNGGSVGDMLRLPANRYGLSEDIIILMMKDLANALKYLQTKNILHRDIKPDNIMQSIDMNGKATFKLTDLGAARQINPGEETSDSIRGTEEYVHPIVYRVVYPDIKVIVDGITVRIRPQFPFEVELWSFGVTIYQCATGQIPFQPFDGTRGDRITMGRILSSIESGCISGIQNTYNGEIQWSKKLPEWCRLSSSLKERLENLLSHLFETDQDRLMKHETFFHEIDQILNLVPVYYLNLKRFTLTCAYFQPDQLIIKLLDQIRRENSDENTVEYHCLFQNVLYPISKINEISVKTFCDQLPIQTSREKPLVIYTFSSLTFNQPFVPKVDILEVQPIKNIKGIFYSVYDWSKNIVGLFFYLKNQLMEYEYVMQISQSSVMTMHRFLKSNLLELLCLIRKKLLEYQGINDLEKILYLIKPKNNSTPVVEQSLTTINSQEQPPSEKSRLYTRSIIKSFYMDDASPPTDDPFSQQASLFSSEEQSLSSIRPSLRLSTDFYRQLIKHDKDLSTIVEKNFSDHSIATDGHQLPFNTFNLSQQINNYSSHIQKIDKYVKEAIDFNETFRRDTMIESSNSLQMESHLLRQKRLMELHETYTHFINEGCRPLILKFFNEYRKWIQQQADINHEIQRIRCSYEGQCKSNIPIDNFRQVIGNELQKMGTVDISLLSEHHLSTTCPEHNNNIHQDQYVNPEESKSFTGIADDVNTPLINEIRITIQSTIGQLEDNSNVLDDIIKEFRARSRK